MKLSDLEGADRPIAIITAMVAVLLLVGLIATGVWQFLFHDPDWDTYVVGLDRPLAADPTGMADAHQTLGDLTAGLVLWATAWLSYRVLAKISMTGLGVLGIVIAGILTGTTIRANAVVRDGVVDTSARGYADIFRSDFDFMIVGTSDLEPLAAIVWTVAHLATLPLALIAIWFVSYRSRIRVQRQPPPAPSWLDHLDH